MRISSLVVLSALFSGVVGCGGGDTEVCDDNIDNDGDETVDCDDADCAGTTACADDGGDDEDSGPTGPEICDDPDGEDEDGDDDANCADSECAGTEKCDELMMFAEIGSGAISTDAWTGSGTQGWEIYELDGTSFRTPSRTGCHVAFTQTGAVHPNAADCVGCNFAFDVAFSATQAQSGDLCETLSLEGEDGPFTVDGNSYGYGYHPAYEYNGETAPALMYYVKGDDENPAKWVVGTRDVAFESDTISYAFGLSYGYYY